MNFQSLRQVKTASDYVDLAFHRAKERAEVVRRRSFKGRFEKSLAIESERVRAVRNELVSGLNQIVKSFPNIDDLPLFYSELAKCVLDYGQLKKSFGAVVWAKNKVNNFYRFYSRRMKECGDISRINVYRRAFYGRASSALKQIDGNLKFLEEARKAMKAFPTVKTTLETVVVAGFPNVGKTTLLKALTGSEPKIASYPFTTQKLMIGYCNHTQIIDTPGLLDRPLAERSGVELQAVLALKHLAQKIIFVIDVSDLSAYSLEKQLKLFEEIKKNFKTPVIAVINKVDSTAEDKINEVKTRLKVFEVSAEKKFGIKELRRTIC
jgi:nucleolar GTP-binding protein